MTTHVPKRGVGVLLRWTGALVVAGLALAGPAQASLEAEAELHVNRFNKGAIRGDLREALLGTRVLPDVRAQITDGRIVADAGDGFESRGHLLRAPRPNGTLMILHAGHHHAPVAEVFAHHAGYLLKRGFDVALLSMPLMGENTDLFGVLRNTLCFLGSRAHEQFACLEHPLRPFLLPVIGVVNSASGKYRRIAMAGLSGGGWTTVVAAAMMPRIVSSYPVAGSWPTYLRERSGRPSDVGDFEQTYQPMLDAASYIDMYALARNQLQIFNADDPCCFGGPAFRTYVPTVRRVSPRFRALLDASDPGYHQISDWALERIARHARRPWRLRSPLFSRSPRIPAGNAGGASRAPRPQRSEGV